MHTESSGVLKIKYWHEADWSGKCQRNVMGSLSGSISTILTSTSEMNLWLGLAGSGRSFIHVFKRRVPLTLWNRLPR